MPLTSYLSASLSLLPCFPFESFHGQAESLEVVFFLGGGTLRPPSPQTAVVLMKGNFPFYDNKNIKKALVFPAAPRIRAQDGCRHRSIMNRSVLVSRSCCNE